MSNQTTTHAFDIETIPNDDMFEMLPEPEVAYGNTKDPEKREKKRQEVIDKQKEEMALNPLYGKICCACAYSPDSKISIVDNNEKVIVEGIVDQLLTMRNREYKQLITFNGFSFDIPFVYRRALILGIKIETKQSYWVGKRYSNVPHCDMRMVWTNWNLYQKGKLEHLSEVLLKSHKEEIDFSDFPELMKTNDGRARLASYCMQDCKLTYDLYTMCESLI